jgi:hypothetical protein
MGIIYSYYYYNYYYGFLIGSHIRVWNWNRGILMFDYYRKVLVGNSTLNLVYIVESSKFKSVLFFFILFLMFFFFFILFFYLNIDNE